MKLVELLEKNKDITVRLYQLEGGMLVPSIQGKYDFMIKKAGERLELEVVVINDFEDLILCCPKSDYEILKKEGRL